MVAIKQFRDSDQYVTSFLFKYINSARFSIDFWSLYVDDENSWKRDFSFEVVARASKHNKVTEQFLTQLKSLFGLRIDALDASWLALAEVRLGEDRQGAGEADHLPDGEGFRIHPL